MKKIYTLLVLLITGTLAAQTIENFTIDSGGTTATKGNINILYTVGEANMQEYHVDNTRLSEGFINSALTETTLDVDEEIHNQMIVIYPNPTSEVINIKSQESISLIQLFDAIGKIVLTTKESSKIKVNHLQSGLYFLKITSEKGKLTKRVIID